MENLIYEEQFPIRLAKLRAEKGVSARDMSLSIGQNAGYINNIENGKALPSMAGFFFICEYLGVSPRDFFDFDAEQPHLLNAISEHLKHLNARQLQNIAEIVADLANS